MRFKRTFRRGSSRRRQVSWLPAQVSSNLGQTDRSVVNLVQAPGASGAQVYLPLMASTDLALHGGEDAVLTRVVGSFGLIGGRANAAPAAAFITVSIVQKESDAQTATVPFQNMWNLLDAGKDNVLWTKVLWCPALPVAVPLIQPYPLWTDIDVKARRKITEDNFVYLCIGSPGPVGGPPLLDEVTAVWHLRTLMKNPR